MTRVHAVGRLAVRRNMPKSGGSICRSRPFPKLVTNAFRRRRRQELLPAWRASTFSRHGMRAALALRCRTTAPTAAIRRAPRPSPSRSPRTSCFTNEVSFEPQDQGSACWRCGIERTYSKPTRSSSSISTKSISVFGAYGVAAASLLYFDKSVQRTDHPRGRLSRGAAEGDVEQLQPVPQARPKPSRGAITSSTAWPEDGYITAGRSREGPQEVAARGHVCQPDQCGAHFRRRIFYRGSPPRCVRALRRKEAA